MSSPHRDPTGNAAVGSVSREWRKMVRLAIDIREAENAGQEEEPPAERPRRGGRGRQETRDAAWAQAQRRRFTGIYRRLLNEPEETLQLMEKGRL